MRRSVAIKPLAWLVMAALFAQSWLGQLATAAVSAELEAVVICTGSGFKVIRLPNGLGPPADPSGPEGGHRHRDLDCTACLVQASVQAIGASSPDAMPWRWPEAVETTVSQPSFATSPRHCSHRSRAPPTAT